MREYLRPFLIGFFLSWCATALAQQIFLKPFGDYSSVVLTVVGRAANVSVSPGAIALGTTDIPVTVTGVQLGDTIICNLASGATLSIGVGIEGCTASAANTVTIRFMTPLLAGVTVGTFTENIVWLR